MRKLSLAVALVSLFAATQSPAQSQQPVSTCKVWFYIGPWGDHNGEAQNSTYDLFVGQSRLMNIVGGTFESRKSFNERFMKMIAEAHNNSLCQGISVQEGQKSAGEILAYMNSGRSVPAWIAQDANQLSNFLKQ